MFDSLEEQGRRPIQRHGREEPGGGVLFFSPIDDENPCKGNYFAVNLYFHQSKWAENGLVLMFGATN